MKAMTLLRALAPALWAASALAVDGQLTLEMLSHPEQKVKFDLKPLSQMSWDQQDRLIESQQSEGTLTLNAVEPLSWTKTPIPVDGNLIAWLKAAGIEEKAAAELVAAKSNLGIFENQSVISFCRFA